MNKRSRSSPQAPDPDAHPQPAPSDGIVRAKPVFGAKYPAEAESRPRPIRTATRSSFRDTLGSRPAWDGAVTKPLGAYRLGKLSRTLWLWHKLYWSMPDWEGTADGVPLAVEQLRSARLALSDEIHPNVYPELPRVLGELDDLARQLVEAWHEGGQYRSSPFGSRHVPGMDRWGELCALADAALERSNPLRALYDLGRTVGEYQLRLHEYEPGTGDSEVPDLPPGPPAFVLQVKGLPQQYLARVPLLGSIVKLAPILDRHGQESFFRNLFEKEGAAPARIFSDVGCLDVSRLMTTLDSHIEATLRDMEQAVAATPPEGQASESMIREEAALMGVEQAVAATPRWDGRSGELRIDGEVVYEVPTQACNVRLVLDEFERTGWPRVIDNPIKRQGVIDGPALSQVLNDLNKRVPGIRFGVRDRATAAKWGWAEVS